MENSYPIRRRFFWLLLVAGLFGCSRKEANPPPSGAYFKTHFQTESQFIVEETVTDLAEMAYYANYHKLPAAGKIFVQAAEGPASVSRSPAYSVEINLAGKSIKLDLNMDQPIWSPATYEEVGKALVSSLGLPHVDLPDSSVQDQALLTALEEYTADTIQKEDHELSASLGANFSDPQLHEEAALLLGTFCLRDASGKFFDIRLPLCRAAAHLAFSRALTGGAVSGVNGQVAEAQLLVLMNNEAGALQRIKALPEPGPTAWVRALRARVTKDYRELGKLPSRTHLENVEYYRAFCESVNADQAWDKLSETERVAVPDYARIAQARGFSVELGHVLNEAMLPLELRELSVLYEAYEGKTLSQKNVAGAVNEKPGRCLGRDNRGNAKVAIIGWGQWSFFSQRHLCEALRSDFRFLNNIYGVPEEAAKFSAQCEQDFSGMYLFPFVRRFICMDEADYHKAQDQAFLLTVATPHLIPAEVWNTLCYKPSFAAVYLPNRNPHINEWHNYNPLPGTVYDLFPRLNHPSLVNRPDVTAVFEELFKLAPYDELVARKLAALRSGNRKRTYQDLEPLYRRSLDYNISYMTDLAATMQDNPAECEALLLKAANLIPCTYIQLGDFFANAGDVEKAAGYFTKAMDECQNGVLCASRAGWMITYYWEKGQKEKAYKVADFAADTVYSYAGLLAKAELLERDTRYSEALEYYKKIEERYNNLAIVVDFCGRYKAKTGNNDFDKEIKDRFKQLFPNGMEKVKSAADFNGAPRDGVLLAGDSDALAGAGLSQGNVIVSVFGIRVHSMEQYNYARETSKDPRMNFVVWKDGQYIDVHASPPNHLFGVPIQTYQPTR